MVGGEVVFDKLDGVYDGVADDGRVGAEAFAVEVDLVIGSGGEMVG